MKDVFFLAEKLCKNHCLSLEEYEALIKNRNKKIIDLIQENALSLTKKIYGNSIYIRALIEFTNFCKNDCYYCGIRKSNSKCKRYRLSSQQIIECADQSYKLGFRTFVLQGGEDLYFSDEILCNIIEEIKEKYPDTAITLSIGERSFESYKALHKAGADRYLLRHETADEIHYKKLHPENMSFSNRINCLKNLKKIGFATGAGFMVSSPFQTEKNLAKDLKFIEDFQPDMCGIGPFICHKETPFAKEKSGSLELTCFLLSVIRIIKPDILLPATTALATLSPDGRLKGILSGANVIMPNITPLSVRKNYELYDKKVFSENECAYNIDFLKKEVESIGYEIVTDRGDVKKSES